MVGGWQVEIERYIMKFIVDIDYHHPLFLYLSEDLIDGFQSKRDKVVNEIIGFYTSMFSVRSPLTYFEASRFIKNLQDRIEAEIKKIVSKKSVYYWLHLYRRIPPVSSIASESEITVWLYRNIAECSFIKYGSTKIGSELIYSNKPNIPDHQIASGNLTKAMKKYQKESYRPFKTNGVFLGEFNSKELMEMYVIERMCFEFWHTTVCIRRLSKGGTLFVRNYLYYVQNNEEVDLLVKIHDEREKNQSYFVSTTGMLLQEQDIGISGVAFFPQYNIQQLSCSDYPYQKFFGLQEDYPDNEGKPFIPNFIWHLFNFDYYYRLHSFLQLDFRNYYGYSLEAFVTTIYLVVKRLMYLVIEDTNNKNTIVRNLMQRAYSFQGSEDNFIGDLESINSYDRLSSIPDYKIERKELKKVIDNLKLNEKDLLKISLSTLGPRKLFIPSFEGGFIIDYSAIHSILFTHMHLVPCEEGTKGPLFEDAVIEILLKENLPLWERKKKLKHQDGTSKEIDASIIFNNILFLFELKANRISLGSLAGYRESLDFRIEKMKGALKQVDNKADWLSTHRKGTNYELPETVNIIVPIVISPFVEYIWSIDDSLWLNSSTPRVCTPSEVKDILTEEIAKDIINKPYIRYLQ